MHDPENPLFSTPPVDHFFSGLEPGSRVRHPGQPEWGVGQIQSVVGARITVNFENAGKVLINARVVNLESLQL